MEGPRAAKSNELFQVIQLINNVFRVSENFPSTMDKEFPLLLCEDNIDNIRIVVDKDIPVSAVTYYKSDILLGGSIVKAASVGAVCTYPEYRGRNLASDILDDVEEKLKKENIDIMLISGTRNLYLKRGCCIVGGFYRVNLQMCNNLNNTIQVINFNDNYLKNMADIYSREEVRYHRSLYEFENLLKGSTTSWDGSSYRIFLINKYGNTLGYVVLKICNEDKTNGYVIEYAGEREVIYESLYHIISMCSLDNLTLNFSKNDKITTYIQNGHIGLFKQNQLGSIKIINFESFMNRLKPYFTQYLSYKTMESIIFKEESRGFIFNIDDEEFCIEDLNLLTQLVFGDVEESSINDYLLECLKDKPSTKRFIETVFPLPFPWAGNMNFI